MYEDEDNDGKFPDESPVEVRYPRSKREEQDARELAVLEDGRPAADSTPGDDVFFPCCFRDRSEIRPRTTSGSPASSTRRGASR